mmetsp:Transcript_29956/g.27421  ORF Transcript_29956/g.27421 Transcript_29956/m.27421 type:complete len:118 (+) Transcript_29956:289-642(+)
MRESQLKAEKKRIANEEQNREYLENALNEVNKPTPDGEEGDSNINKNELLENINEINQDLQSERGKANNQGDLSSINVSEAGSRIDLGGDEFKNDGNDQSRQLSNRSGGEKSSRPGT